MFENFKDSLYSQRKILRIFPHKCFLKSFQAVKKIVKNDETVLIYKIRKTEPDVVHYNEMAPFF